MYDIGQQGFGQERPVLSPFLTPLPRPGRPPVRQVVAAALIAGLLGGLLGAGGVILAARRGSLPWLLPPTAAGPVRGGSPATELMAVASRPSGGDGGSGQAAAPSVVPVASVTIEFSSAVTQAAERVGPAVVGIINQVRQRSGYAEVGTGSGVIINRHQGLIVTNHHVVAIDGHLRPYQRLLVQLSGGNMLEAELVGSDPLTDLAVLRVAGGPLPAEAEFGDSDRVKVGELAIAIGNPLGLEFQRTVTAGIISGINRELTFETEDMGETTIQVLQTDAAINPGNSGGPLVNAAGQVIGINSAKIARAGVEGIGFAIPSNFARPIIDQLVAYGKVRRPVLGVYLYANQAHQQWETGYRGPGVVIYDVIPGGPAERAGLRAGDIILRVGDRHVNRRGELTLALGRYQPGQTVEVTVRRYYSSGRYEDLKVPVTLGSGS